MAWKCKNCGVLKPKEVTYFEQCDYCGEDVEEMDMVMKNVKNRKPPKIGDLVMLTKYGDGDVSDSFTIRFLSDVDEESRQMGSENMLSSIIEELISIKIRVAKLEDYHHRSHQCLSIIRDCCNGEHEDMIQVVIDLGDEL